MAYEIIKGQIASSGTRADIPLEEDENLQNGISYAEGYAPITSAQKSLGGLPANRATLNQFFYITSSNLFEFQSGNFPTFNANALQYMTGNGYPLNSILWCAAEERFVKSAVANNTDNFITTPSVIGTSWLFLNDDEVSDLSTGLTLTNTLTSISVDAGFTKSATSGRLLKVSSTLTNLWSNIQSNSSLTPSANSKYNLYIAYNPSTQDYLILASSYSVFVPSLPSGYTDYALLGYMSTDNNIAVNNVYPDMDLNDWYLSGGVLKDKLTRFCANSGNVDSNGNADLMSISGSVITWKIDDGTTYKPLVCTPANELKSFTLTSVNNFDASTLADGTYTLCINKYGNVSAMGALYAQKAAPTSPSINNIWVNIGIEPLNAYYYTGSWVAFNNVPIANITVESGSIMANETLPYNKKYYTGDYISMLQDYEFFGNGALGDVIISSNTTLNGTNNSIYQYNNLTLNDGVKLSSNGEKLVILVKNNLIIGNNATIDQSAKISAGSSTINGSLILNDLNSSVSTPVTNIDTYMYQALYNRLANRSIINDILTGSVGGGETTSTGISGGYHGSGQAFLTRAGSGGAVAVAYSTLKNINYTELSNAQATAAVEGQYSAAGGGMLIIMAKNIIYKNSFNVETNIRPFMANGRNNGSSFSTSSVNQLPSSISEFNYICFSGLNIAFQVK